MSSEPIPESIRALGDARQAAREARDWATADRLRAEIEAAGWIVTDQAHSYRLSPAHPPDVVADGRPRYGSSQSVPSRLEEAASGVATIVLVATDRADGLERSLASIVATAPADLQIVIVANDPAPEQETVLRGLESRTAAEHASGTDLDSPVIDVVWTSARLGVAAALNVGLRRVAAPIAVVFETGVEALGDFVTPLVAALADPAVAVTGAWGLRSGDLRRFETAPAGDVTAIRGRLQAFRRADFAERGPLDEHFSVPDHLDAWWSLVLRDAEGDEPPRRAVALDLPVVMRGPGAESADHEAPVGAAEGATGSTTGGGVADGRARLARRNLYRIIDRFNGRPDLAAPGAGRP